jgi:ubiquinone/menaquinone biosynthesis C-methylase UbiE
MSDAEHSDDPIHGKWAVLDVLLRPETAQDTATDQKARRKAEHDAVNRLLNGTRVGGIRIFSTTATSPATRRFARFTPADAHFDAVSRRLVLEVLGDCPLDGSDVLDVSCGRGAVAVTLRDYFTPRSYVGVDLSPEAVAFCRREHARANFDFHEGDAEALPLPAASVDVVVNVEASHNYPNPDAFFSEVRRVLRPRGWFLYTDFLPPSAFDRYAGLIAAEGFEKLRDVDITSNVVLASDLVGDMRAKKYRGGPEGEYMEDFVAAPGSETYRAWRDGRLQYRLYTFRRSSI